MGAWGSGIFENDGAADWLDELEGGGVTAVRKAIEEIARAPEGAELDVDDCSAALAAAEVIATGLGQPGPDLHAIAKRWLSAHEGAFAVTDAARAIIAVWRIGDESELQGLWDEEGRDDEWHGVVDELIARLRRVAPR